MNVTSKSKPPYKFAHTVNKKPLKLKSKSEHQDPGISIDYF